jgi:hypothetical protein
LTHTEATIALLELWKLPEWLCTTLAPDAAASTSDLRSLSDCVRWADSLAVEMGYANPFQAGILHTPQTCAALPVSLRSRIGEEFPREMDELAGVLGE